MNKSVELGGSVVLEDNVISINFSERQALYGGQGFSLLVRPGITTFVGPNGAGKTQVLRVVADQAVSAVVSNKVVRFISAGRNSPLERFRSSMDAPGARDSQDAAVGHAYHKNNWWKIESIIGDLLALEQRPDLKLKVEARLQQLFQRSLQLEWNQSGIRISISPTDGGDSYTANHEASGILQIVGLLAAIHNDQIGVLLIDEPEISLHPQHQAFIRQEMEAVAGDPKLDPAKKIIVIATHSPSMLSVRTVEDISTMLFFTDNKTLPVKVDADNPVLKNKKLIALVARLSATHRLAFFAKNILLVEGPSDEIITTQLAEAIGHPLMPVNAQIIPVTGKGEFVEVVKLFKAMGKEVAVLADLDALTDSNALVNYFSNTPIGVDVAGSLGVGSLVEMDASIRAALASLVDKYWAEISVLADKHSYWLECSSVERDVSIRRRATLGTLFLKGSAFTGMASAKEFEHLVSRYAVLLSALETVGLFFLRKGTIENYYETPKGTVGKPEAAALEASAFKKVESKKLEVRFSEVFRALLYVAPVRRVDENTLLRTKLAAVVAALFQQMSKETSAEKLSAMAKGTLAVDSELFTFENVSTFEELRVKVSIASSLFQRSAFPLEIGESDNVNVVIRKALPIG